MSLKDKAVQAKRDIADIAKVTFKGVEDGVKVGAAFLPMIIAMAIISRI
jgi:hypothetical protein